MVIEADTNLIVRMVASAIRDLAKKNRWGDDDFRLYYRTNPDWGQVAIILVAKSYPEADTHQQWRSTIQFLKAQFGENVELLETVTFVQYTFDQMNQGGIYAIPPNYQEYWAFYPVKSESSTH